MTAETREWQVGAGEVQDHSRAAEITALHLPQGNLIYIFVCYSKRHLHKDTKVQPCLSFTFLLGFFFFCPLPLQKVVSRLTGC